MKQHSKDLSGDLPNESYFRMRKYLFPLLLVLFAVGLTEPKPSFYFENHPFQIKYLLKDGKIYVDMEEFARAAGLKFQFNKQTGIVDVSAPKSAVTQTQAPPPPPPSAHPAVASSPPDNGPKTDLLREEDFKVTGRFLNGASACPEQNSMNLQTCVVYILHTEVHNSTSKNIETRLTSFKLAYGGGLSAYPYQPQGFYWSMPPNDTMTVELYFIVHGSDMQHPSIRSLFFNTPGKTYEIPIGTPGFP